MSNVPLAPLGRPVTGTGLGCAKEHHDWSKWRRKYPNLVAYLDANPGPVGRFTASVSWLEHYAQWLEECEEFVLSANCPGKTCEGKRAWIGRVKGEVALALARAHTASPLPKE